MTSHITIERLSGAPTWPDDPHESLIVIADPASQVERDLVKKWVVDNAPDGVAVDVISIPPPADENRFTGSTNAWRPGWSVTTTRLSCHSASYGCPRSEMADDR